MRYLTLVILTATLFFASTAKAESTCPWGDGGYCVDTLARETLKIAQEAAKTDSTQQEAISKLTLPEDTTVAEGLSGGSVYFNFYEGLWASGVLGEKKAAFDEATAAGGTKIGGVNLVVLGARTLQKMVEMNWLTMEQAQQILNEAKHHD